jgi:putative component of membrane protein insertase Oxa1/YidC/SpoIIIJ protein YidD
MTIWMTAKRVVICTSFQKKGRREVLEKHRDAGHHDKTKKCVLSTTASTMFYRIDFFS